MKRTKIIKQIKGGSMQKYYKNVAGKATTVTVKLFFLVFLCIFSIIGNGCENKVKVVDAPVTGLNLNKTTINLHVGESETLIPAVVPSNATNKNVRWYSSNESVATVSSTGSVYAVSAGSAIITCETEEGYFRASCSVIVTYSHGYTFYVSNADQWQSTINGIRLSGNNKNYNINITSSFSVPGGANNLFLNLTGLRIELNGNHTISLASGSTGPLLMLAANQEVVMTDVKLQGNGSNNNGLVIIGTATSSFTMRGSASVSNNGGSGISNAGILTMLGNASVFGNTGATSYGGGVSNTGTFTMQDNASVSNNTAQSYGGGVYNSGIFTMQNNTSINGNKTPLSGGGVYNAGTFNMSGNSSIENNVSEWTGGGVATVFEGFIKSGGIIQGNRAGSFPTIGALGHSAADLGTTPRRRNADALSNHNTTDGTFWTE